MVAFDRKTLRLLKYIRRHRKKGITFGKLHKKFSKKNGGVFMLDDFIRELYVVVQKSDETWINPNNLPMHFDNNFLVFITPKGNELVERRCFDFWKFVIPLLISVSALLVSIVNLWLSNC